jgi:hypothetical protein
MGPEGVLYWELVREVLVIQARLSTMSVIKNEASRRNFILTAVRAQLEHRALWLYLLCDEARKHGLEWEAFASDAVMRCGLQHGAAFVGGGGAKSLKGLRKKLFTMPGRHVFEMKVRESTDDSLSIDFHYCPLVKAWQRQGLGDRLCELRFHR